MRFHGFHFRGILHLYMGAPQFLMKHLHLRETEFLWLFGPMAVAMMIGAWISGSFRRKNIGQPDDSSGIPGHDDRGGRQCRCSICCLPPMLPWSIVPLFVYVVGMSIAMPSLTLLTLDLFPAQSGLAASCQGFISLGANSVVSAFVPLIWGTTLSMAWTEIVMLIVGTAGAGCSISPP